MNRISTLLIAVALPVAFAAPTIAQEGKTLGTVVNGNTTTTFKAADTRDIDTQKLKTWNAFAAGHPKVASELAHNPALINDDAYARSIRNSARSSRRIQIFARRWRRIPATTLRFRRVPANSRARSAV